MPECILLIFESPFYILKEYTPAIARWGVGVVFFIFGISQLLNPQSWMAYLPDFALTIGVSATNLIYMNGVFDLAIGILLLFGIFTRVVSLIGILHIIGIIISIGYNDVAVRDFGLLIVLVSVFLHGADKLCLVKRF